VNLDQFLSVNSKATVAVPFPEDEAILRTCRTAADQNWARFLFFGDPERIGKAAEKTGIDRAFYETETANTESEACELTARSLREGRAQVAMKGQVHTGDFSRALFSREAGLLEPGRLVSHIALCQVASYHKLLFMTDCAINIKPDYDDKLRILDNAVRMAQKLGVPRPRVGLVAPVETVNPKIDSTIDAERLRKEYDPEKALLGGPFGLDAALSREAAAIKKIESPVAGDADILLFPDLNTGNAVYKTLTVLAGATIAGLLIGLRVPVVVTSRSDNEETKLLSLKMGLASA
jgi:phosphate butyryltransferase